MRVAITGANGRIGRVLTEHWRESHDVTAIGDESDLRIRGDWEGRLADAESIVHLAAVLDGVQSLSLLEENLAIVLNVVRAANNARRIIC
jgi:nucleoside-diphosphate-sugar epimerase